MEENKLMDNNTIEEESGMENFAAMFEESEMKKNASLKQGAKVTAKVLSISGEVVFVDIGEKIDGFVETKELEDENGDLKIKEGDDIDLYVVSVKEDEIKLSNAMTGNAGLWAIRDAFTSEVPVLGKVNEVIKGGYSVKVMGKKAFCPMSQMSIKYVDNPAEFVSKSFKFKITKFEGRGKNIVVSRIPLLKEEESENLAEIKLQMEKENIFTGKVVKIQPFGLFVEIVPGIEGLVHISQISWSRVNNPSELYKIGDEVEFKILDIQKNEKGRYKISLSIKQILPEPWDFVEEKIAVGAMYKGKVTRIMPFGAFVEICDGIEGLVHVSELSYVHKNPKTEDIVSANDEVDIKVLEIDKDKRKIALSIRQAGNDPWEQVASDYPIGTKVEGTLEKKEKFGYFINIKPGITGLLPKSKIEIAVNAKELEDANIGDKMTLNVMDVNLDERKITLAPEIEPQEDWEQFNEEDGKNENLSALGQALMEKMKENE